MSFGFSDNNFEFSGGDGGRTFYFAVRKDHLDDSDFRYRYKEPEVEHSGKHGNKTTYFSNSEYFAEKIRLPSEYFGKYMAGRLSCPYSFDKDKNCITFKGEYSLDDVKNYFFEFVKIYVMCQPCDYPECTLRLDDKKNLIKHCESCGANQMVNFKSNDKAFQFIERELKKNKN
jgi:translation initiation factor 2 beta subunit (eIF-2beta)/eIF-5